jgi:hypothetical protein
MWKKDFVLIFENSERRGKFEKLTIYFEFYFNDFHGKFTKITLKIKLNVFFWLIFQDILLH